MARESSLSHDIQVSGGLKQFRSIAEGSQAQRDGPFGPPPKQVTNEPLPPSVPAASETVPDRTRPLSKQQIKSRREPAKTEDDIGQPEASSMDEKVTVPLSHDLRARSEALARAISRSRSIKRTRITSNSIIRVALETFLNSFSLSSGQSINSEAELLEAARRLKRR